MYEVVGIRRYDKREICIEDNLTEAQATKMCEEWGWIYDDGKDSYWMQIDERRQ